MGTFIEERSETARVLDRTDAEREPTATAPRRRRWPVMAAGILVVVVLLAASWVLLNRHKATPVSLEEAVGRFRDGAGPAAAPAPPSTAALGSAPTTAPPTAPTAVSSPDAADVGTGATGTATPPAGETADPSMAHPTAPPADGVYTYDTTGRETLSIASARHDYPAQTQVVVRHGEGCSWTADHLVLREHRDVFGLCTDVGGITWLGWRLERTFFGQTFVLDYRCAGPAVLTPASAAGSTVQLHCETPDGDTMEMVVAYVGDEVVDVGGTEVPAVHLNVSASLDGSVRGTSTLDLWSARDTGLRLREVRETDTVVDAPLGQADYHESATFLLRSLNPTR